MHMRVFRYAHICAMFRSTTRFIYIHKIHRQNHMQAVILKLLLVNIRRFGVAYLCCMHAHLHICECVCVHLRIDICVNTMQTYLSKYLFVVWCAITWSTVYGAIYSLRAVHFRINFNKIRLPNVQFIYYSFYTYWRII